LAKSFIIYKFASDKKLNNEYPFLSLNDVTGLDGDKINEAVHRVVDAGRYLQGRKNEGLRETNCRLNHESNEQ